MARSSEVDIECPSCGCNCPDNMRRCMCGYEFPEKISDEAKDQETSGGLSTPKIIALVFAGVLSLYSFARLTGAADAGAPKQSNKCLETYSLSQSTNDSVRSTNGYSSAPAPNLQRETATVVRGMARNICPTRITKAMITFEVVDAEGKPGTGAFYISALEPGQTTQFERSWMGKVTLSSLSTR